VAPNGQHLPFTGSNLQKISKQSLLEMLHNNQKKLGKISVSNNQKF
jgi:hypothetical protein